MEVIKFVFLSIAGFLGGWKLMDLVALLIKRIVEGRYVRKYNCIKRDLLILDQIAAYDVLIRKLITEKDDALRRDDMTTVRDMTHLIEGVIHLKEECTYKFEKIKKGDVKRDGNN